SLVALTVGESLAAKTICVPPRRSRPSCGRAVTTTYVEAARTAKAMRARMRDDRFTTASGIGHPLCGRRDRERSRERERTVYGGCTSDWVAITTVYSGASRPFSIA